jgi:RimJ/RimL family protein N-acetyltransferase
VRLPERIEGDGLVVRRWCAEDGVLFLRVVEESREHLRPWVRWVEVEPQTLEGRRRWIAEAEVAWREGGPAFYGFFSGDDVVGGGSLHPRGPGVAEVGYWLHPAFAGRGIVTRAARLLVEAALSLPGVDEVELRHDRANAASEAVARRLGFRQVADDVNPVPAPRDSGVDLIWRLGREDTR